jgi:nucleoside-diphosphate-sugar epimerase
LSVLVTGATGFLGAEVVAELLRRTELPIVAWGRDPPRIEALQERFAGQETRLAIEARGLLDPGPLRGDIDTIVHAAAARPPVAGGDSAAFRWVNVEGTQHVVRLAEEVGCRRIVYVSTQAVYGREGAPWPEDAPPQPETAYAKSKLDGEAVVLRAEGIDGKILRLSRLYGVTPFVRWDELPGRFAQAVCRGEPLTVHGTGEQRLDFLHVRDAARCVAALVTEWDRVEPAILNLGAGSSVSLNALADLFRELAPTYGFPPVTVRRVPDHPQGGMQHLELDTSRVRRHLGWLPSIGLRDGLSEYLARLASAGSPCSTQ